MAETQTPPQPVLLEDFRLILSFLREDIKELRQEFRSTNERIDDLAKQLDSRYARLVAVMIAVAGAIIAAVKI